MTGPICLHVPLCICADEHEERLAFREKLLGIQFQGLEAQARRDKDTSLDMDLHAYKSLRDQGVQPAHVFGSAEIAAGASTKFEAEHHLVMSRDVRKEFLPRIADAKAVK